MKILAIDTSCDETSVAVTQARRILANVIFSQVKLHKKYGGVYPTLAKREHKTKINLALNLALKKAKIDFTDIDAFAVTFGPGLAPALEVGVQKAKELSQKYHKPLIPVDHIEGHLYSAYAENKNGKPTRDFEFPILSLVVSGGHTQLVLIKNHLNYQLLGQSLDDAAGEALDKAARLLGFGYPGGPIIEKLAEKGNAKKFVLPTPMLHSHNLDFSYSGLKTAFKRLLSELSEKEKLQNLNDLSASFQAAVIKSLLLKLQQALKQNFVKTITLVGGVAANKLLRQHVRMLGKKYKLSVLFPPYKYLNTDNAAMIGVVGYYKFQQKIYLDNPAALERIPRANLDTYVIK